MKLVIDISEEAYKKRIRGDISPWITTEILDAVGDSIPLTEVINDIKAEIEAEYILKHYDDGLADALEIIDRKVNEVEHECS